jgi:hypothetical protein
MERVSRDVDRPAINDPDKDPTASHALTADGGKPFFNPGFVELFD